MRKIGQGSLPLVLYGAKKMNMITTGAFLSEMSASEKQKTLVNKLVSAWEKKNSKTARAGGTSLMALSLAACGGSSDKEYTAAELATATSEGKLAGIASVDTTADDAAAVLAAVKLVDASATTVTAVASNATTAATTAAETAASTAAALVKTTTDATLATLQSTYDALVATTATLQASYDALIAPKTSALTTATDTLVGASGNDAFTGAAGTVAAADTIIDATTTDSDTLTITDTASLGAFTSTNIETVSLNLNSLSALTVDAQNFTGITTLNVTRGDVSIGGSVFSGNKAITVNKVDAAGIAKIVVGAGTTTVDINAEAAIAATGSAGLIVDADTATGNVTVDMNATINAAASTGTVEIDGAVYTTVAERAKASEINAASAATVNVSADVTGTVTVNAAKASTILVSDAQGGATITGGSTSTADTTITVVDVDASGATITTGTGSATAAAKQITVTADGTTAATDTITVAGAGVIALDVDATGADAIDIINLSSTGGAVTYTMTVPTGGTDNTITSITGTSDVTVQGNEDAFSGVTITTAAKIDMNAGTAGTIDADSWTGITTIDLGFDNSGNAISYDQGQNYEITNDQTGFTLDLKATGTAQTVTITAGDDNGTSAAVGTITLGAVDVDAGDDTVAGTVSLEASIANVTATSFDMGAKQNLVISGDENVTLGTVTGGAASSIVSSSTGNISLTTTTLAPSVTTGSGGDTITVNGADVHTVSTGGGNDTITITSTNATSSFDGGTGTDSITITDTSAIVVIGGDGTDTFTTGGVIDAIIVGGEGSDTFTLDATRDLSAQANFAISGVEKFDIGAGNLTLDATQFAANNTVALTSSADTFRVDVDATTGKTIDASGVTIASGSTATLTYFGNTGNDTLIGGVAAETFNADAGADSITGGATGTDTYVSQTGVTETGSANASTGSVINLGSTAVTGTSVYAKIGQYLSNNVSTVAAGKGDHVYAADLATNLSVLDTISGIENVTATSGRDYIVGSTANNKITNTADTSVDYFSGGDGDDSFEFTTQASFVASNAVLDEIVGGLGSADAILLNNAAALTIAATDDLARISGVEKFTASATTAVISITSHADLVTDGFTTIDLSGDTNTTGANVVDLTAVDAVFTIIGGKGVETITTTEEDFDMTVSGGGGNDTLISGSAANTDTFKFEATGALNGKDTITLTVGAGKDKLDFSAFGLTSGTFNATAVATTGSADIAIDNKVVMLTTTTSADIDTITEIAAFIQGGSVALSLSSGAKGIVIAGDASGANDKFNIFFVDDTVGATAGTISADDVVFVGISAANIELDTIVAANLVL
jgi:Ca2+-binding RTX toxin-like protein